MNRFICLLFLLLSNSAFSKQSLKEATDELLTQLSTTREAVEKESLEWEKAFTQYLIEDEDPNIQLLGYFTQLSEYEADDKKMLKTIGEEFNSMLSSNQLDNKSITSIAEMCSYNKLKPYCDQGAIFAKQSQRMPDNAFIYLRSLETALKDNNQKNITQSLDDMAQSKYFDSFYYLHPGYRVKLEEYVNNHPFPENKLAIEKLDLKRHLCCDKIDTIEDMQGIMIHIMVIGVKMAQPIPPFRNLTQVCKNDFSQEKSCLKTAEHLINRSKSIISVRIGYAIKTIILKERDDEMFQQATEDKINYIKLYECLGDIMNYGSTPLSLIGAEFMKIAEPIERKFGEVAYLESLAQSNYDYYSNLGETEINNPENCK